MKKKEIKITSARGAEFDTEIIVGKEKYIVQTENSGPRKPFITTRIYKNGQILFTKRSDYKGVLEKLDAERKVLELMHRQHEAAIDSLKAEKEKKTTSDYLDEVRDRLKIKNKRGALRLLSEALEKYPGDPFLLSYYGCLEAIANKNYKYGIDTCLMAIENLKKKVPFGEEFFYPVFYLNLGRAYFAAGRKKEAVEAFNKGIKVDGENRDLLWELRKLGMRRKPPVPFLKRSNPINKYMGRLLHALKS